MEKSKKPKHFLQQPEYPGGEKALTQFIYDNLRYPETALAVGTEGVVVAEYDIDNRGNVVDTRVIRGIGHGCDEEACRVLRLLKFDVGKNRGVRVIFHKKARVQFKKQAVRPQPPAPNYQVSYIVTPAEKPAGPKPEPAATYSYTVKLG